MADPTDILLKLKTEGDTKGAEAVRDGLKDVRTEEQKLQAQADVDEAKRRQAIRLQEEQAKSLRDIADVQHRIIAAKLADSIGQLTQQFAGLSPELDMVLGSSRSFLEVLSTTGDPIRASLALTASSIGSVIQAWQKQEAFEKQVADQTKDRIAKTAALRAAYAKQVREERMEQYFKREVEELENEEKVLIRIARIRESERQLAATEQANKNAAAVDSGAKTEVGAQADNLATSAANKIADILAQQQAAKDNLDKVEEQAVTLDQLAKRGFDSAEKQKAAVEAAGSKQREFNELLLDFKAEQVVNENKIREILSQSNESGRQIGEDALKAMTEVATRERDAVKAEVERLGASAPAAMKAVLSILDGILEKDGIRANEVAKYAEAQGRLNRQFDTNNTALMTAFNESKALLAAQENELKQMAVAFKAMKEESDRRADAFAATNLD